MKGLFLVLFVVSILFARDEINIDSYISKIKRASPEQRVKLMNEFKRQVAQMNKEERIKSIQQMQKKMQSSSKKSHVNMQDQHNNEMTTYQNMNQKQAVNQLIHTGEHTIDMNYKEH